MAVFRKIRYIASEHSIKRLIERTDVYAPYAKQRVEFLANAGYVELVVGDYRYIRYDNLWLPCLKTLDNTYIVKTVLTSEMLGDLQYRLDKYHEAPFLN